MLKVIKIISTEPYTIKAKFSSNEIRRINLSPLLEKFPVLKEPTIFSKAKLDDYPTISWDNLASIRELDGTVNTCALDFSPEMLYHLSEPEN